MVFKMARLHFLNLKCIKMDGKNKRISILLTVLNIQCLSRHFELDNKNEKKNVGAWYIYGSICEMRLEVESYQSWFCIFFGSSFVLAAAPTSIWHYFNHIDTCLYGAPFTLFFYTVYICMYLALMLLLLLPNFIMFDSFF